MIGIESAHAPEKPTASEFFNNLGRHFQNIQSGSRYGGVSWPTPDIHKVFRGLAGFPQRGYWARGDVLKRLPGTDIILKVCMDCVKMAGGLLFAVLTTLIIGL